jgi:hypothetical protein
MKAVPFQHRDEFILEGKFLVMRFLVVDVFDDPGHVR